MEAIGGSATVAHAPQSIAAFERREGALDADPQASDQPVADGLPIGQLPLIFVAAVLDAVLDATGLQCRPPGLLLIGLVGVDGRLIADDELIGNLALIGLGRRHHTAADQAGTKVNADMNLVTEEQPAALALACPIGIAVMRRAAFRAVWRRPAARSTARQSSSGSWRIPALDHTIESYPDPTVDFRRGLVLPTGRRCPEGG